MSQKEIKYIVFLVIIICLFNVFSTGLIFLIKKANNDKLPPVEASDVIFSANSNTVLIKSIISVSEDFGKKIHEENGGAFGYLEFEVENVTNLNRDFQIYITKKDTSENEINPSYVTFYLTDSSNKPLPNYTGNQLPDYNDFSYISDKADSKELYKGSLGPNEVQQYTLRVWIADNFVVFDTEKSFSFEIGARAV